jgi:hypothetical protein
MHLVAAVLVVFAVVSSVQGQCQECSSPYGGMCCEIPSDNTYYLTTFCDGYPHDQTSCGNYCDSSQYFTADCQRFGCDGNLNICAGGTCDTAQVIDAGPADWVENDAGMPIIDASPQICQDLFGSSSCGWSDQKTITASPTLRTKLGPFNVTAEELKQIIAEGEAILRQRFPERYRKH